MKKEDLPKEDPYLPGDGDIKGTIRPGSMDYKKYASKGEK